MLFRSKKKMEVLYKQSQDSLKAKENEILKLQEKAKKEGPMATDEAKQAMLEEYQRKTAELQQLMQEKQRALAEKDAKAQEEFVEKVKKIAMKIAIQKGFEIVLAREHVLYIDDKFDITKAVIDEVNK